MDCLLFGGIFVRWYSSSPAFTRIFHWHAIMKITQISLPFFLAEWRYALLTSYYGNDYKRIIVHCIGFRLSNSILWYVVEILVMYTMFYVFKKRNVPLMGYMIAWVCYRFWLMVVCFFLLLHFRLVL